MLKYQKWILNGIIVAFILAIVICFWPIVLLILGILLKVAIIASPFLLIAVLFKAYKYYSQKNKE